MTSIKTKQTFSFCTGLILHSNKRYIIIVSLQKLLNCSTNKTNLLILVGCYCNELHFFEHEGFWCLVIGYSVTASDYVEPRLVLVH